MSIEELQAKQYPSSVNESEISYKIEEIRNIRHSKIKESEIVGLAKNPIR